MYASAATAAGAPGTAPFFAETFGEAAASTVPARASTLTGLGKRSSRDVAPCAPNTKQLPATKLAINIRIICKFPPHFWRFYQI
jgi:hypothetical protein